MTFLSPWLVSVLGSGREGQQPLGYVTVWRDSQWQKLAAEGGGARPLRPSRRRLDEMGRLDETVLHFCRAWRMEASCPST